MPSIPNPIKHPNSTSSGTLRKSVLATTIALGALALNPSAALACACGCGVFDIGTPALFPSETGGVAYLEYDSMNQNRNWSGTSSSSPDNNADKQIRTRYYTAGLNYMFNHAWGVMAKLPWWDRTFTTDTGGGELSTYPSKSVGDIRVEGMYTGFSPDMATGITFGLKLPTGDYTNPNYDRDTQIGTGSTDLLLGAFHRATLDAEGNLSWFVQGHFQHAIATRVATDPGSGLALDYRPGDEVDAVAGLGYSFGEMGPFTNVALIGQIKGSLRARDTGGAAVNTDSGYSRLLVAPGISASVGNFRVFADVESPVYQNVNGNQLTAKVLYKVVVGMSF